MNTSGEAADQVVRMSLEVGEAALKISGAGAKQLAVLLYAILKEQKKTRGRARLETLVRSGRPLTVFSVKESDLRKFVQEAKRYGILYCAVRNPRGSSDGMVDIMVKEEDAPRINRIVERFQFATVTEAAQIKTEIEKSREQKVKTVGKEATGMKKSGKSLDVPERPVREKSDTDQLMEELMGAPSKKGRHSRETPLWQRRRNPFCPSLSPRGTAEPPRVLLICICRQRRRRNRCGRSYGRFRREETRRNEISQFQIVYSKGEEDSKKEYWSIGSHRTGKRKKQAKRGKRDEYKF